MTKQNLVFCILDGWGWREAATGNAIALARTPNFDRLWSTCPHALLRADGRAVGLPQGQFGNSEVGHMNIGAGRVVEQLLPRIDDAINSGEIAQHKDLQTLIQVLQDNGNRCHLMGLFSDGGVHSHSRHWKGVLDVLQAAGIPCVLHPFTDGRDTSPKSAEGYLQTLAGWLKPESKIGTLIGRYYAMDRDDRMERTKQAYRLMVHGEGERYKDAKTALHGAYERGETDEFVTASVIGDYDGVKDGDALIFMNFRGDRARQIMGSLLDRHFRGFQRPEQPFFSMALGMASYSAQLDDYMTTLFPPVQVSNTIGEVIAAQGLKQLRIAETEKYAHVTFFLNNGRDEPFPGEERVLIPSPKVATYDLQPEMSIAAMTTSLLQAIQSQDYAFIAANFANPDMVGHTGNLNAAIAAVEAVDKALGEVAAAVEAAGAQLIVTADHGNADQMVTSDGAPHTAHTLTPVPLILYGAQKGISLTDGGRLCDLAPTMLALMGIDQPREMTGESLLGVSV